MTHFARADEQGHPLTREQLTAFGSASQIIGRVSMDMLTVDLTDLPDTGAGSEVELWGARVSVDTVAKHAGTIAYELLCNVKRVSFL